MTVLQKLRQVLAKSTTGQVLRRMGLARPALRMYENSLLRRGTHTLAYQGRTVTFDVHDRFDIARVDSFLCIERALIDRIVNAIRVGDTVFDVGGNMGIVSVLVATSTRDLRIKVHTFEPNPETARRAHTNAVRNGCHNVTVHTLALGRTFGAAQLHTCGLDCGRDSMIPHGMPGAAIDVRVERGDDVAGRLGLQPSVVKIDVEGAEMDVLLGMEELFSRRSVRELFIEVHPPMLLAAGHDEPSLVTWLESHGFRRVWREPRGSETHQHFRLTES